MSVFLGTIQMRFGMLDESCLRRRRNVAGGRATNSVLYRLVMTFSARSDPHGLKSRRKRRRQGIAFGPEFRQFGLWVRRAAIEALGAFSSNMIYMPAFHSRVYRWHSPHSQGRVVSVISRLLCLSSQTRWALLSASCGPHQLPISHPIMCRHLSRFQLRSELRWRCVFSYYADARELRLFFSRYLMAIIRDFPKNGATRDPEFHTFVFNDRVAD